jgi:hypothetical protein
VDFEVFWFLEISFLEVENTVFRGFISARSAEMFGADLGQMGLKNESLNQ